MDLLWHSQATLIRLLLTEPEVQHSGCSLSPQPSSLLTHMHPCTASSTARALGQGPLVGNFVEFSPRTGIQYWKQGWSRRKSCNLVPGCFLSQQSCQSRLCAMRNCYPMSPHREGCYRTDISHTKWLCKLFPKVQGNNIKIRLKGGILF